MPSKLCPVSLSAHPDVRAFVEAGSPLIVLVDVFDHAEELLALRPDLILVGRVSEAYHARAAAPGGAEPELEARAWVEQQAETYRRHPAIQIWAGPHTPDFGTGNDPANMRAMKWYAAFETERLRLLADLGLRGVTGNFGAGTPDLSMWVAFLPALYAAQELQGFLGLREYSSPWMWWLTGKYQMDNCAGDDRVSGEGDTGWLTLRYRKVYRDYLAPNNLGDLPLVITECGLDAAGPVCPGFTRGPWKAHQAFWQAHDGAHDPIDYWRSPERDAERYYAEQLIWYDGELQRDDCVVGAAIFAVGARDSAWQPFDIAGSRVTQFLVEFIRKQRGEAPLAPTQPTPEPVVLEAPPVPEAVPIGEMALMTPIALAIAATEAGPAGQVASVGEATLMPEASPQPTAESIPPLPTVPPESPPTTGAAAPSPAPTTIFIAPGPGARAEALPSILMNATFEEGVAYFADATRELAVPVGWGFSYHDQTTPTLPRQAAPFGRPVTALVNTLAVAPADRERVFAGGVYCWKVTGAAAPVWVRLFQSVESLKPGERYRLEVNVLPDLVVRTHPHIAYAGDPLSGEVRLEASFDGQTFDSGWKTGREAPYGRYARLSLEFAAPSPRARVALELRGRWILPMGAWYVDELSLVEA